MDVNALPSLKQNIRQLKKEKTEILTSSGDRKSSSGFAGKSSCSSGKRASWRKKRKKVRRRKRRPKPRQRSQRQRADKNMKVAVSATRQRICKQSKKPFRID